MVIRVLGGSTSRVGKPRRKVANVGDIVVLAVKKALANSDFMKTGNKKARVVRGSWFAPGVRPAVPTAASCVLTTTRLF